MFHQSSVLDSYFCDATNDARMFIIFTLAKVNNVVLQIAACRLPAPPNALTAG